MGADVSSLPPGFVLDQGAGTSTSLPDGFQLDEPKSASLNESANAFLGGILEGVPVVGPYIKGGADRLGAGVRSLINGTPYQDELSFVQGRTGQIARENPKTAMAGNVIGAVAGTAPLVMAAPGAFGAGAGPLLQRSAASALSGAALGGADAAVRSSGDLQQSATGAALGGTLGALGPVVAEGVGAGVRNMMDRFGANRAAQQAGISPEAARVLNATIGADGSFGPQGVSNMARAGNEAMLADAGPNARAVLDTAIQKGGPGATAAREAIEARVGRGATDLTTALDAALGSPAGVTASRTAIREASAPARAAAYKAAYSAPIDYASPIGQNIENLVRSRVPGDVVARANRLMQLEGNSSKQILAKLADDGSVVFEQLPDVRQLDYITRALNQAAESGEGAGALGGQTTLGRAYQGLSRELRGAMRQAVPEYATALDVAADPIRRSQAVDMGSKLLSPSMTRDAVEEAVQGMSAAEKDAVAQGVRSRIDDAVANVTRTLSDGNMDAREAIKALRDLSSRANREKLSAALGDARVAPLFDEIDRVATSFDLRAAVTQNSKTYARQATSQMIDDLTAPGILGTAAQGKPVNAVQRLVQAITNQSPEAINSRQGAIYSDIANLMTRPAADTKQIYDALINFQKRQQASGNASQSVQAVTRALLNASPPVANQQMLRR
jgi:hypothetical protein